jgi:hypothetical protein
VSQNACTNVSGDFTALEGLPLRDVRLEGCRHVSDRRTQTLAAFRLCANWNFTGQGSLMQVCSI